MLSDSCHSGTIGDLKNDLEHYHGPAEWQDGANLSLPSQLPPQIQQQSVLLGNNIIQYDTCWIYAPYLQELWLTPLNSSLREQFGNKTIVVKLGNNVPTELINNGNKLLKYNTIFRELDNGQYEVFTPAIPGIKLLVGALSTVARYIPSVEKSPQLRFTPTASGSRSVRAKSEYDNKTCRWNHYHGGKKRSLGMRSNVGCQGGELRIISGCEESQTSEDLRVIQDAINKNLAGFSQHSVISWDHALPGNTNAGRNIRAFRENLPQQQSYVPLYTDMHASRKVEADGYNSYTPYYINPPSYYRTYYNTRSTSNYNVGSEYNSPSNYYYGTGSRYSNAPKVKRFI